MRLKNVLFSLVAICLPLVGFVLVEGALRVLGVAQAQRIAFQPVSDHEDYLVFNTNYLKRYFSTFEPVVAFHPFQKQKKEGTFRVFVLGGSSTVGYPYHTTYSFPARLQARLEVAAVGQTIEVINLGINAASSYVLWDLKDELVAQQPDALILYAGHNEFYGAFGVGSTLHSLGNQLWLKRGVLRLKRSALFLLLAGLMPEKEGSDEDRSFFARAIEDAQIVLHGDVYTAGLSQYAENMRDLLATFQEAEIPVYAGLLASNLKDRVPLSDHTEAQQAFDKGKALFAHGDTVAARAAFLEAKENDTIRFRAPEAFNEILHAFEEERLLTLVDVQRIAQTHSESQIEDGTFFTDHLHPDYEGYNTIAGAFFERLKDHHHLRLTSLTSKADAPYQIDPFEQGYAHLQALSVLSAYPFDRTATREKELQFARHMLRQYQQSTSDWDRLVHRVYTTGLTVPQALEHGIRLAKSKRDTLTTLLFYRSALDWHVFDDDLVEEALSFGMQTLEHTAVTEEILFHAINRTGKTQYLHWLAEYRERQGYVEDQAVLSALMERRQRER